MLAMFLQLNRREGEEALEMFLRGMVLPIVLTTTEGKLSLRPELIHLNSIAITAMSKAIDLISVRHHHKTRRVLLNMRVSSES